MIGRGILRRTAVMTVGLMIWLAIVPTLAMAGQDEDVFQRAKRLIDGGDLEAAIKLLEDYILKIKAVAEQKKNVAEAYYTLAKSYYMAGEDGKSEANLRLVFETYPEYIVSETNKIFLARVVKIRAEVVQAAAEKKALEVKRAAEDKKRQDAEAETRKAEEARKEEEKRQQPTGIAGTQTEGLGGKAKRKFPWLVVVGGAVAVAVLAAVLLSGTNGDLETGEISISSTPSGAKVFLDGTDTGQTTACILTKVKPGTRSLKLELASYGKWEGSVQVNAGQKAEVSATLAAYTYEFVAKWGSPGSGNDQFDKPPGIAVDSSGNVYVADANNHRIQKFTSAGIYMAKFGTGTPGTGDGQLYYPGGIAVDSSGNVYVANYMGGRIQKFNANGAFLLKWGIEGGGDGQFVNARGIAVDASNNVFVAADNRVQKFSSTGTFLAKWGSLGSGDGSFNLPYGIAVAPSGNVYVSEYNGSRVQQFTSSGTFVSKWGNNGGGNGQFVNPKGIDIDPSGYCFVADSGADTSRIQKFTSAGGYVAKWGKLGTGDGQFKVPSGIAIDSSGYVYVVESDGNRVQKFRISTSTMAAARVTYSPLRFGSGLTPGSPSSPLLRGIMPGRPNGPAGIRSGNPQKDPPPETIKEIIR